MLSRKLLLYSTLVVPCLSACFLVDPSDESGPDPQVEPGGNEPADMAGTTEAHNAARASVQPAADPAIPPLSWSSDLAGVALSHATKCVFEHSENSFGENLYAAVGSTPTSAEVVNSWVSEVADYDYSSNSCSPGAMCGHYTQVVWRNTATVGCAAVTCTVNSPFGGSDPWINWVCNYDPPGNFVGEKPY